MFAALLGVTLTAVGATPIQRSTASTTPERDMARRLPAIGAPAQAPESLPAPAVLSRVQTKAPAAPYSIPFSMMPTKEQMENECIVIDNNNDGGDGYGEWSWLDVWSTPICWYNALGGVQADDWLVFPAVRFDDAGKVYKVSIDARGTANLTKTYESLEVRIGKAPTVEALDRVILSQPVIPYADDFLTFSASFGVPEAGDYYIAVRSCSPESWRLPARNLRIEATAESSMLPGQCSELALTPDPTGALKINVSFKLPATALNGAALPADQTLTAVVTGSGGTASVTGKPGEVCSCSVDAIDGLNSISVLAKNEAGEGSSISATVRCGLEVPAMPVVSTFISDDNYTLTLKWDPVTTGAYGGIVNPATVVYDLYTLNAAGDDWEIFREGISECQYTLSVPAGTPLGYVDVVVTSRNEKGTSDEDVPIISELLGTPYSLPIDETLEGQSMHYTGLTIDTPSPEYNGCRFVAGNPADLDPYFANDKMGAMMGMNTNANGGKGHLTLPKFSTRGASDVQVILPIFLYSDTPAINVYAKTNSGAAQLLGTVDKTQATGWTNLLFPLPASLEDSDCVSVSLDIDFASPSQFFLMEGYTIKEGIANDMAMQNVQVAPNPILPGEKVLVTAKVQNEGTRTATPPTLTGKVSARGQSMGEFTLTPESTDALPLRGTVTYTGEFTLLTADCIGSSVSVSVAIATPDDNPSNDSQAISVPVAATEQPVITDLRARFEDDAIHLSWSNPVSDEVTDGFEFLTPFTYGAKLGRWTNLDFDGRAPYTFAEVEGVTIPDDDKAKAFQVINFADSGLKSYGFEGWNGSAQVIMAMAPQQGTADDWLISPRIESSSKVSFMLDIVSPEYTETVEVLYSSTDADPDSFKKVLTTINRNNVDWEEVNVQLPDDACYFAIHYCAADGFGILIDDISYFPEEQEYELKSYRLLRDEQPLATLDAAALNHVDSDVVVGTAYTYHLVPIFLHNDEEVEGLRSNTASLIATGIEETIAAESGILGLQGGILFQGHEGETITICDMAGRLLKTVTPASASHTEPMPAGIYLAGSVKVIVK